MYGVFRAMVRDVSPASVADEIPEIVNLGTGPTNPEDTIYKCVFTFISIVNLIKCSIQENILNLHIVSARNIYLRQKSARKPKLKHISNRKLEE